MSYDNIEKVTSDIFKPSSNMILRHCVKLASRKQDGRRELFHSEFTYMSSASYTDTKFLKSIKLKFNSYLLLEEVDKHKDWTSKESVMINVMGLVSLSRVLRKVTRWFDMDDLYYLNKGRLHLNPKYSKLSEIVKISGKVLAFEPTVIIKDDEEYEGVLMYVNNKTTTAKLTLDRLDALYYTIKNMDLYQAGLSVIAYIGRPEFDKYNVDIGIESKRDEVSKFYKKNESSKGMQRFMNLEVDKDKGKDLEVLNKYFDSTYNK